MKFKKKPIIIDAWLWDESRKTLKETGCQMLSCAGNENKPDWLHSLYIKTLEGSVSVNRGDYIIKGVKGEFYPCKPDIFEATYDKEGETDGN